MIDIDSDWKKHAAQVHSDQDVEKAFLDQAYMFIQNKATPLMQDPYRLGFEIVYKNDANSKMVGIFAFKVGEELIYAPAFFVNGSIKGTDLLYRHKSKTFVPLTNDWATYLVGTQQNKTGESIDKGSASADGMNLKDIIMPPDYSRGGAKTASYSEFKKLNEWLPDVSEVYETIVKQSGVLSDAKDKAKTVLNTELDNLRVAEDESITDKVLDAANSTAKKTKNHIAETKSASRLRDLILDVGPDAVKQLTDLMQKDATFAQNILTHVGLNNVLIEEVKEAKGRCWSGYEPVPGKEPYSNDSCRPVGSKKKKKKTEKSANVDQVQGLMAQGMGMKAAIKTAYPNYTEEECNALASKLTKSASGGLTLHMGFLNSNVKQASEKLAANGYLFDDKRPETDLVHNVFEEKGTEYSGISEAGVHQVLKKDGTTVRCLVAPSNGKNIASSYWYDDEDDMDTHQYSGGSRGYGSPSAKYVVIEMDSNASSCVDSKKIITADNEAEKPFDAADDMDGFSDTPSSGGYYRMLDVSKGVNGSTLSDCFYVKSTVSAGDGVNKYRVDWSSEGFSDDEDLPTLTINPDYESNNYKDKVFKKGDVAFVKVDKKKEVDLASPTDLHNLIMKGGVKSASIHKTENGFVTKSANHATSEQSRFSTTCYLMKFGSFAESLAVDLLDKVEQQGVISFYMPKTAHNLSFGENPDDYFTEDMDDVFGIAQNSPQSVELIADSAEPNMPDEPRVGDSIKFDSASELEGKGPNELAALAQQLNTPSLFEHGVVGSLANTYDSSMLIDKYFPDLEKALDRLGRMVFLFYWKPEDFSHLYGSDDQSSLEDMLVSNFKQFGELVLELMKKINSFTETAGRTY